MFGIDSSQVLFHGTPVTIESFLSWKAQFDAELAEMRRKRQKEEEQSGKDKLTGKQLFETDHNLDTSDIQFLEEAEFYAFSGTYSIPYFKLCRFNFT
ncbi:hypothetical protein FKM82_024544 [Ascaphus truei]